jgi:DnaK suppressor protein
MNETEIEQFKHMLLRLRSELKDLEESPVQATKPVELDQAGMGRRSLMDAMLSHQKREEGARRRQRQLQKIDGALRRIESGEYGKCFICEEDIDVRRLSVDPTNTRCMKCIEQ